MSFLRQEVEAVRAAVMFFTRIPLPSAAQWDPQSLQRAAAYFPFVGWIVGAVAALVFFGAVQLWSSLIASGLSLAASLLVTGAFHEDGFADVCDGFGGGTSRERVFEIMRDSRVGAFGAIGITVLLVLKWHTVATLSVDHAPFILLAGHAVSRGASGTLMTTLPYVQETGKAKPLATRLTGGRLLASVLLGVAPMLFLPAPLWWALVSVIVVRFVLGRWFMHRIGGYTGDCLGATQQVGEVAFLLTIIALP